MVFLLRLLSPAFVREESGLNANEIEKARYRALPQADQSPGPLFLRRALERAKTYYVDGSGQSGRTETCQKYF